MASPPEDGGAERALAPGAGGAVFSPVSPAQAQAAALEAQLVQPTLFSYVANDLVWAREATSGLLMRVFTLQSSCCPASACEERAVCRVRVCGFPARGLGSPA